MKTLPNCKEIIAKFAECNQAIHEATIKFEEFSKVCWEIKNTWKSERAKFYRKNVIMD